MEIEHAHPIEISIRGFDASHLLPLSTNRFFRLNGKQPQSILAASQNGGGGLDPRSLGRGHLPQDRRVQYLNVPILMYEFGQGSTFFNATSSRARATKHHMTLHNFAAFSPK